MKRPIRPPGSRTAGRCGAPLPLLLLALVLTLGCERETPPAPPAASPDREPRQVLGGMVLRQTSAKGLAWVLRARKGTSDESQDPVHLEGLVIEFYDGHDQVRSTLTSKRGQIDEKATVLEARDSVVVWTPAGDRLETEYLRWDPKRERVTTDRAFKFRRGRDLLSGVGFEADPDLRAYEIQGGVHAVMRDAPPDSMLDEGSR